MTIAEFIISVKWPLLFLIIVLAVLFAALWSKGQDLKMKRFERESRLEGAPTKE